MSRRTKKTAATSGSNQRLPFCVMVAALGLVPGLLRAQSPAALARQWEAAQLIQPAPVPADDNEAISLQYGLIELICSHLGRPVGYKAALTNPAQQKQFGVDHPVLGVLLEKMLLEDHADLPLDYAARPAAEGDLLVRVGDPNINEAETDLELLAGLDAVIPFIELPDLLFAPGATHQARTLQALNVGARAGVMGTPIPLTADQATLDRLAMFTVRLVNQDNRVLGEGSGQALLGHPIHVVRWIRDTLKAQGDRLREGHLLSLGSVTPLVPLRTGGRLTAFYDGLTPAGTVSVSCTIQESVPAK